MAGARDTFEAIDDITHVAHGIMPEVFKSRTPPGSSCFAWGGHWVSSARSAWARGDDETVCEAMARIPAYRSLFLTDSGAVRGALDEAIVARIRTLRRPQALADLKAETGCSRSVEERHVARKKCAWSGRHRRISNFGVIQADGQVATTARDAAAAVAAHRGPIFDSGEPVDKGAAARFLQHCRRSAAASVLEPLSFPAFL